MASVLLWDTAVWVKDVPLPAGLVEILCISSMTMANCVLSGEKIDLTDTK